jgi:hypothetical protein
VLVHAENQTSSGSRGAAALADPTRGSQRRTDSDPVGSTLRDSGLEAGKAAAGATTFRRPRDGRPTPESHRVTTTASCTFQRLGSPDRRLLGRPRPRFRGGGRRRRATDRRRRRAGAREPARPGRPPRAPPGPPPVGAPRAGSAPQLVEDLAARLGLVLRAALLRQDHEAVPEPAPGGGGGACFPLRARPGRRGGPVRAPRSWRCGAATGTRSRGATAAGGRPPPGSPTPAGSRATRACAGSSFYCRRLSTPPPLR